MRCSAQKAARAVQHTQRTVRACNTGRGQVCLCVRVYAWMLLGGEPFVQACLLCAGHVLGVQRAQQ